MLASFCRSFQLNLCWADCQTWRADGEMEYSVYYFFLALWASPMHVCLSIHSPVSFYSWYSAKHLNYMAKRFHMTTFWYQNSEIQFFTLDLWKPQCCYNFRHVKSVRHLKFHPSESNSVAVISGLKSATYLKFHFSEKHCIHNFKCLWNQMSR